MLATLPLLQNTDFPSLYRDQLTSLQVNLGYRCNQSCLHCHVNAGPNRSEMMSDEVLAIVPQVLQARQIELLDLTGGSPELHPGFRRIVQQAVELGVKVIDRCNLSILFEPGQEDLAEFLVAHEVEIIASLPCYSQVNVDQQRGNGVFDKSIAALKKLNSLGYGKGSPSLTLNLIYNPQGATLPPGQSGLEADYKRELDRNFGIVFNSLYVITNMPIQRFGSSLISKGQFNDYMQLLKDNYSHANLNNVMCRNLLSVDWQGFLYDCDFNQQLGLRAGGEERSHLRDLLRTGVTGNPIAIADHCFGCTAGQGSSCAGAL